MISLIIISKDRAMQLDLLLRSADKFCGDLFTETIVVYNTSTPKFQEGYDKIQRLWPSVKLIQESNFEPAYRNAVEESLHPILCILCDDCLFYRKVSDHNDEIRRIIARDDVFSFILGIGGDSRYSGTTGKWYKMPEFQQDGNILTWEWKTADRGEFQCPFMFAANFYKKENYVPCLEVQFASPSSLESSLQHTWQKLKKNKITDLCACLPYQALVHSLNNRVQDEFKNPAGNKFPFTSEELNSAYLSGKIVDLDALDFSEINGLHTEIDLIFKEEK